MEEDIYTISEVAQRLKLHAKTVLAFVRDGRLRATKVGKQYRIAKADLDAFTGHRPPEAAESAPVKRRRHVEVSSIVEIDAISLETAARAVTHLQGALKGRSPDDGHAQLDTIYYEEIGRLKLIISASPETTARLLNFVPILIAD
ncbi:MAG TPA: helix-turn-helix domain-containing protein [Rhizomicrobium sp.]|nr:helix-turn-helix domain-containing protein [Rhizomicrobium sp.]